MLQLKCALQFLFIAIDIRIAEAGFHAFQFSVNFRHTRIARQRGIQRCQRWIKLGVLRQVSRCDEAGAGDASAQFGGMFPFDEFEQRRLPRAVRTDQADALSALDLPI